MNRSVMVYALVLVASLGGAYYAWTHEGDPDFGEKVVILSAEADEIVEVVYESEKVTATMSMRTDELGRYMWVRAEPKVTAQEEDAQDKPGDPKVPANPHSPAKPPAKPAAQDTTIEEFKAGKAGDEFLERVAPFVAKRTLEGVDDGKLEELGLAPDAAEATLTITRQGREPRVFQVGGNVYGGANVYVRDQADGKVYVVDAKLVRGLQAAKRTYPDRTLLDMQTKEISALTVAAGEASASFEQHNPDDPQAMFWSNAGEPEANPTAANWIDKALRLRSSAYVSSDDEPQGLEEVYSFTAQVGEKRSTTVAVYRAWAEGGEDEWYARSAHTRGLVRLHRSLAAEAAADLESALEAGQ